MEEIKVDHIFDVTVECNERVYAIVLKKEINRISINTVTREKHED